MKRLLFATAMLLMLTPGLVFAGSNIQSPGKFGAGLQLGYPHNGLSFNYFIASAASIQVDASVWLKNDWNGFGVRADLLWWQSPLARPDFADLVWYFGPGANLFSFTWKGKGDNDGYVGIGAEFPVGIGLQFKKAPIDLNLEAVPVLHVIGSEGVNLDFDVAGLLNGRYYF